MLKIWRCPRCKYEFGDGDGKADFSTTNCPTVSCGGTLERVSEDDCNVTYFVDPIDDVDKALDGIDRAFEKYQKGMEDAFREFSETLKRRLK